MNDAVNGEVAWQFNEDTRVRAGYGFQRSDSHQSAPPPITRVSASSIVPAAFNPFGQDVEVGFVHTGFGPVHRDTSTDRQTGFLSAEGRMNERWTWNGRFEANHRVSDSETADLDAREIRRGARGG